MQILNAESKSKKQKNSVPGSNVSLARGASALTDKCLTFHILECVYYCHVTFPVYQH